jgi:hypothetical protein
MCDLDVNVGLSHEIMEVYVPKLKCENLGSYGLENLWAPRINHCRHDSKKAHEGFGNNYHHIYNMVRTNTLQVNDMWNDSDNYVRSKHNYEYYLHSGLKGIGVSLCCQFNK